VYDTILVPLDVSPADDTILDHVRRLARVMGSRLILVHIAEGHVARNQDKLNLEDSEEMRSDREYLERRRRELEEEGFEVTAHLGRGEPSREILSLAEQLGVDLIAMSTHGHGFLMDVVLGSVASEVRHRASIPVLMLRAKRD
jgi:universal stress protein A